MSDPETERAEIRYAAGLLAREYDRTARLPDGWLRRTLILVFDWIADLYDLPRGSAPPVGTLRDAKREFDARVAELRLRPFQPLTDGQWPVLTAETAVDPVELMALAAEVAERHGRTARRVPVAQRVGGIWACGVIVGAMGERYRR